MDSDHPFTHIRRGILIFIISIEYYLGELMDDMSSLVLIVVWC